MRDELELRDIEYPDRDYDLLPDDHVNPSHVDCEQCHGRVCLDADCGCDWDKATERAEGPVHVSDALCNAVCLANNVASIIRLAVRR